ncbi:hypothetical protein PHMEG_00039114 [Phytophthora megakarya]|uniref:HTH psq-type domain-containing protein n=1 Tax=Phytophthora megakarya TaxID=4795 RepID=A0A225UGG3_9STRA|nr:hypothetical protein PHMEG_00039114 [Phytophthora megakarya]
MSISSHSHFAELDHEDRKRSASEDADTETKHPIETLSSPFPAAKKSRKTAKYLQHDERCRIIKRIDSGETQAALAREFGVTRAAVNQLYKKRDKVLSRGDPNCDQETKSPIANIQVTPLPELRRYQTIYSDTANLQLRSVDDPSERKVALLKTMRDVHTSASAYHRASARLTLYVDLKLASRILKLLSILIEEAFARYDHTPGQNTASPGQSDFCGITLGVESDSMLKAFLQIDTFAQSGSAFVEDIPRI